ncbi:MAG: hypothetical protein Q9211_004663 [Gyalolechia sp. 1 TL-2023]
MYNKVKDAEKYKENRERITREFERDYGLLSSDKVDYILGLEDKKDRREVLNVCSNQSMRKLQRPVVLTVGHPAAFVGKVLQLKDELKSKEQKGDMQTYASQILVYYFVARWLILHWKALSGIKVDSEVAMTDENLEKISDAKYFMLQKSANIELPCEKRQHPAKKTIQAFEHMQSYLEDYEGAIREEAVKAKEVGKETAAEDAVKLYSKLTELLQAFNRNAEKDV